MANSGVDRNAAMAHLRCLTLFLGPARNEELDQRVQMRRPNVDSIDFTAIDQGSDRDDLSTTVTDERDHLLH